MQTKMYFSYVAENRIDLKPVFDEIVLKKREIIIFQMAEIQLSL